MMSHYNKHNMIKKHYYNEQINAPYLNPIIYISPKFGSLVLLVILVYFDGNTYVLLLK